MSQIRPGPPVILIVEDEPLLRLATIGTLEDAGYRVLEARDADEAIVILEERSDIRLVFTDIQMPGSMDGLKLAEAVRDRWPPVKLILTSGNFRPQVDLLPEGARFILKPYAENNLIELLHTSLAESS